MTPTATGPSTPSTTTRIRTVPLLPCRSVDEITAFAADLGFTVTYMQQRPNPYVALHREGLELHYFGIEGFVPEDSYGSCLVLVEDTEPLYEAFAGALRRRYGRLPLTGLPRITRPRRRKNSGGLSGFSLIDPAGNWIRVLREEAAGAGEATTTGQGERPSPLAEAVDNAVVLADSKGDPTQAVKILRGAITRLEGRSSPVDRVAALAYLAELEARTGDLDAARASVARVHEVPLDTDERVLAAGALAEADEVAQSLTD